jgi:glycosyltransferase involved in cell wall biosynthesis
MRLLWMSWKDRRHPAAGGAEIITDELLSRLASENHEVTLFTSRYSGSAPEGFYHGYRVVRRGGRLGVYLAAWRYYRRHLAGRIDVVIDEMNTIPFFASRYAREPVLMFVHQLAREIWFYEMPIPASLAGYLMEPLYLRFLSATPAITVSESTSNDLRYYGFTDTAIISEGIELFPLAALGEAKKREVPTILSLGSLRAMKRPFDAIRAFEIAKASLPALELVIAGGGQRAYVKRVQDAIRTSPFADSIRYEGRVSPERKLELMRSSHILVVPSVKEGWCLAVTEANSQGTPAAVYDVDGLRDSVHDGVTGMIARMNTPAGLADALERIIVDPDYEQMRQAGWRWSKEITFDRSYREFRAALSNHGI